MNEKCAIVTSILESDRNKFVLILACTCVDCCFLLTEKENKTKFSSLEISLLFQLFKIIKAHFNEILIIYRRLKNDELRYIKKI